MERISKKNLTMPLSEDLIAILAEMANEIPQSKEWHEIFDVLQIEDIRKIMDKKSKMQKPKEQERRSLLSNEEQMEEDERREKFLKNLDPFGFYGNMGQPETPQEYKDRYGTWPPGYDKNGNKIGK